MAVIYRVFPLKEKDDIVALGNECLLLSTALIEVLLVSALGWVEHFLCFPHVMVEPVFPLALEVTFWFFHWRHRLSCKRPQRLGKNELEGCTTR